MFYSGGQISQRRKGGEKEQEEKEEGETLKANDDEMDIEDEDKRYRSNAGYRTSHPQLVDC